MTSVTAIIETMMIITGEHPLGEITGIIRIPPGGMTITGEEDLGPDQDTVVGLAGIVGMGQDTGKIMTNIRTRIIIMTMIVITKVMAVTLGGGGLEITTIKVKETRMHLMEIMGGGMTLQMNLIGLLTITTFHLHG